MKRNHLKLYRIGTLAEVREEEELVVEPKVMEPYEPIGDNVPRKVAINRKQKEYASFHLEQLLHEEVFPCLRI